VQLELDRRTLPGPASGLRVSVVLAAPLRPRQQELFSGPQDERLQRALLWDRLSSRIGRHGVLGSLLISEAQPEYAYRYEPLVGAARRRRAAAPRKLPLRPLLLESQPVRLLSLVIEPEGRLAQFSLHGRQHRVAYVWGPERIQTGWWRGAYIRRDYYRVETQEGRRFWVFRQGKGDWFLHGVFD